MVAILAVVVSVPIPLLLPLLVDEVLLGKPDILIGTINQFTPTSLHGPILYISVILALTVLMRASFILLNVWQTRQFTLIAKDVSYRLRKTMLEKLKRISMSEYELLGTGTVTSYFVTDMNAIDDFIGNSISKTLIAFFSLIGISIVLLWMHWQLALFIMLMNPVVIYFTMVIGKKVKTLKKRENKAFETFQQSLGETLEGIQQIRASNRETHYINKVIERARNIRTHSAAFSWKSDAANRFSFGIFLVGFDIFRGISMLMVVFSDLSVGQMLAVFGYLWFMMTPVQDALNVQYAYYGAKAALSRINRLFTLHQEPDFPHEKNPFRGKITTGLRLENISFSYDGETPVLQGVQLSIKAGQKVALVGASGGGKSTLVQVILGMYPADTGMLYFDDVPVTQIGLDVIRQNVATVLQHPALFNDSVRQNLSLGQDIDDETLWQALEIAQLSELIENTPEKLETIIGNQGMRLSGGQKQRLAIARMVLSKPKVVILDEATSALDTQTEAKLHTALQQFLQDRTTIIIAHRLSAVKQSDLVYVFEDGHIIESGSHEQLIGQKGLYNRLYGQVQS